MDGTAINYTLRQPVGVAACISPWNLPYIYLHGKLSHVAGNTVVKTLRSYSYDRHLFSKICIETGLPKGVLNIVHGLGTRTGDPLTTHPDTPIVSFTGEQLQENILQSVTSPMFKKLSLELGGKNPNIVFKIADFDKACKFCLCIYLLIKDKYVYVDLDYLFKKKFTKGLETLLVEKDQN